MRRILTLLIILLFSEFTFVFGGTPGMLIRCRPANVISLFGTECDMPGFITYAGHCYPLSVDGACPEVPPFTYLVPMDVVIEGESYTICVPDCSSACVESCSDAPLVWDPSAQGCVCEDIDIGPYLCGCPDPLVENFDILYSIIDGSGYCTLPEQDCYGLGVSYTVQPIICDGPQLLDTITITIKPAGGGTFVPFVDALTIEDLENCDLIDGTAELLAFVGLFGEDDRFAFVADENGCIVLEFIRDPTEETVITFLDPNNTPITIPACPKVFDPCSCRPENITDNDGIVLFWYDELNYTGSPNTDIDLQSNAIPEGFLDVNQVAYPVGYLGTTDGTGLLNVQFYRKAGFDTEVVLVDAIGQMVTLMSTCTLPVNFCANIVPTLGEWAVITLSILLLIISIVAFKARQEKPLTNEL